MKYLVFSFLLVGSLLVGCSSSQKASADGYYGEKFKVKKPMQIDNLVEKMATVDSINVQVKGKVEEVCQKKGCWMSLTTDEGNKIFVKFKDYAFFMPLDLMGNEVVMNGHAFVNITPVDELRHYAEDAGKSPEEIAKITQPEKEFQYLATGVYAPGYKK